MRYFVKRLGFYFMAFIGAFTLNFFLPRLMPGNPVQMRLGELAKQGGKVDPSTVQAIEKMFGINSNEPLIITYFRNFGDILKGDWGVSFTNNLYPVTEVIKRPLGWTIFLCGVALILSFIINTFLGIFVAWRRGSILDTTLTVGGQIMANIPAVIIALTLSYTLAYNGVFPKGYAVTPLLYAKGFEYVKDIAYHAFLPITAILLSSFGGIMGMRANMINQLGEDYIVMGIAKGVPDKKIMFKYCARNAMLPVVTSFAMSVGFLLGGQLLIENIFNYPGLGKLMIQAINGRDYPLMQGILLMTTILMLFTNFIADISVFLLDPRIRKQSGE